MEHLLHFRPQSNSRKSSYAWSDDACCSFVFSSSQKSNGTKIKDSYERTCHSCGSLIARLQSWGCLRGTYQSTKIPTSSTLAGRTLLLLAPSSYFMLVHLSEQRRVAVTWLWCPQALHYPWPGLDYRALNILLIFFTKNVLIISVS